jgi:hypothetical protein
MKSTREELLTNIPTTNLLKAIAIAMQMDEL